MLPSAGRSKPNRQAKLRQEHPVEGNVNRIEMLKRQMYGRAGFALLRKRVICIPGNTDHGIRSRALQCAGLAVTEVVTSDVKVTVTGPTSGGGPPYGSPEAVACTLMPELDFLRASM